MIGHVFKNGHHAATLRREGAHTVFEYEPTYVENNGREVATTLPVTQAPLLTPGASVPAFFAGLLPEGRRLSALVRKAKTSADDELGLLLEVGSATVGDVYVVDVDEPLPEKITVHLPRESSELDFDDILTSQGVALNPRLAGVQDKASAHMISFHASKADVEYIIKFDPPEFRHLCRNEFFFLTRAKKLKIDVAQAQLISDKNSREALLIKRFDRKHKQPIHLEDGGQVLGRYPADKYNLDFEEVSLGLVGTTIAPVASGINLLTQLAFAWLSGNGDMHAKNLSILGEVNRSLIAPMYDIPSSVFYSDLNPELALDVAGHATLTVKRFNEAGRALLLPEKSLTSIRERVLKVTADLADAIDAGALPFDSKVNAMAARQLRKRHAEFSRSS